MSKRSKPQSTTDPGFQAIYDVALEWQRKLKEVGQLLLEAQAASQPVEVWRQMLADRVGLPMATSRCAMRWAAGEFGTDEEAHQLLAKVRHSELAHMPAATVDRILHGRHRVVASDDGGRVVTKTLDQMTRREGRRSILRTGVKPIAPKVVQEPEFRSCRANAVTLRGRAVVFVSRGTEIVVHMEVPAKILQEAMDLRDEGPSGDEIAADEVAA